MKSAVGCQLGESHLAAPLSLAHSRTQVLDRRASLPAALFYSSAKRSEHLITGTYHSPAVAKSQTTSTILS